MTRRLAPVGRARGGEEGIIISKARKSRARREETGPDPDARCQTGLEAMLASFADDTAMPARFPIFFLLLSSFLIFERSHSASSPGLGTMLGKPK